MSNKIDINKFKIVPNNISNAFELCVFGDPDKELILWASINGFELYPSGKYTNIKITTDKGLSEFFTEPASFEYLDGFSPNLNKKLHIGHFSNLVLAKAFKSLGVSKKTVSIFGDTLDGEVTKEEALECLKEYFNNWEYQSDKKYYASEMKYNGNMLKPGDGEYIGTMIFEVGEEKVVGIKSNGSTSYFYQDVALAEELKSPTLYLTGKEQGNHFKILKNIYNNTHHIGLGLVKANGQKMSSRVGNVIFIEELLNIMKEMFNGDLNLIYNVFAGHILKSSPDTDKNINLDTINNVKNSGGLYISYTMARMNSAGVELKESEYPDKEIEFAYIKTKSNLSPHILFNCILEKCKKINALYLTHHIKDNEENKKTFQKLISDIIYGTNRLGLFKIEKIDRSIKIEN